MKKIMIAFAAIACAVVANAATVNWQSGNIYVANAADGTVGSTKAAKDVVTAYFFELASLDAVAGKSALDLYKDYVVGGKTTTLPPVKSTSLGATVKQTVQDSSGKHYGLIIYEDLVTAQNFTGVDAFVKTAVATVDVAAAGTFSASNLANQQANWSAVAVPEPTSGLLLLLGMAGLALRRKQA